MGVVCCGSRTKRFQVEFRGRYTATRPSGVDVVVITKIPPLTVAPVETIEEESQVTNNVVEHFERYINDIVPFVQVIPKRFFHKAARIVNNVQPLHRVRSRDGSTMISCISCTRMPIR